MHRPLLIVSVAFLLPALCLAQGDRTKWLAELQQAFEFKDEKQIDKLVRQAPDHAWRYFQDLRVELWTGKKEVQPKIDALMASWPRVFEGATTLEKVERWVSSQDQGGYQRFLKVQENIRKAWDYYLEAQKDNTNRKPYITARDALMEVAKQMESTGHKIEAAETWNYVAVCLGKIPERSVQDRKDGLFALRQFLAYREAWEFTKDQFYLNAKNIAKSEEAAIEQAEKEGDKRREEGYADGAKGIDALAMPGVAEVQAEFEFHEVPNFEELDYSQKGGPVPAFWWVASFGKDVTETRLSWFRRVEMHLVREGAMKFAVSSTPSDPKRAQPVDVASRPKPSEFFLDPEKKVPYSMFFWIGGDRERVGECEVNLQPADVNTPVYYRSAASWHIPVGTETVTLYDDNCNGWPMDGNPFEGDFKMHTLGKETAAPLLDSMRVGKGPRVPFSEFVKAGPSWFWIHRTADNQFGLRPLNPEYFKTGKVKLTWSGPKPTAPVQLVIQGSGDFKTACFDVSSQKEVEVPAGKWQVIWGRVVQGKGARVQMATIYGGDSQPFEVEPGKTFELKMGAPFTIAFEREGTDSEVKIDATKVLLQEKSGCILAEMHGMVLVPEVLAAKAADGKGAKQIAEFQKLTNSDFLNDAAGKNANIGLMLALFPMPEGAKEGSMVLEAKLPHPGMKVQLAMKKHPLFGKLESAWK